MAIDAANPGVCIAEFFELPRYTFQPVLTAAQCQANVCPQGSPTDSAEEAVIMVTSLLPGNYNERNAKHWLRHTLRHARPSYCLTVLYFSLAPTHAPQLH